MTLCKELVEVEIVGAQCAKWILECRLQKGHTTARGIPSSHELEPICLVDLLPMEIFEFARDTVDLEKRIRAKKTRRRSA